jgi:hypothetical protein
MKRNESHSTTQARGQGTKVWREQDLHGSVHVHRYFHRHHEPRHPRPHQQWRHQETVFNRRQPFPGKSNPRAKKEGPSFGAGTARNDPKESWIAHIRSLRMFLKNLRDKEIVDTTIYQKYYALAKGGVFKNTGQLKRYMQDKGVLKKEKPLKAKK